MNERVVVYLLMEADRFFSPLNAAEKKLIGFATATTAALTAVSMKLAATYESNLVGFTTLAQTSGDRFKGVMSNVYGQMQLVDKKMGQLGGSVKLADVAESVRTSLEGMTAQYRTTREESALLGKQLLDDITALAVATPYQTEELIAAGRTLVGYGVGVQNLLPTLNAIGEVVAGVGGDLVKLQRITLAYGQVISKNKFYAQELRQFTESGVGARDFADTLGLSVKEFLALMEAGQIGSDVVVKAFQRMTKEGGKFHGLMRDLMKTPAGRMNTLRETVQIQLREFGRKAWEGLESSGFWGEVGRLLTQMQASGPAFGERIKEAFTNGRAMLLGAEGSISAMMEQFRRFKNFDLGIEFSPESDALNRSWLGKKVRSSFEAGASFNDYGQPDWSSWFMTLPYALEEFGLGVKGVVIDVGEWVRTYITNPLANAFDFIVTSFQIGLAVGANYMMDAAAFLSKGLAIVLPLAGPAFKQVMDRSTRYDTEGMWADYRERMEFRAQDKLKARYRKLRNDNLARINETKDKVGALLRDYQKKLGTDYGDNWLKFPGVKPLTFEEQLLGPKMTDFVNRLKTSFREGGDAAVEFGRGVAGLTERLDALEKAANPVKFAWKDMAAETDRLVRSVTLFSSPDKAPWWLPQATAGLRASVTPHQGAIQSNLAAGAVGGFGGFARMNALAYVPPEFLADTAAGLEKIYQESLSFQDYLNSHTGLAVDFKKVFTAAGSVLAPMVQALSNTEYVDVKGNVGMLKIVEALQKAGMSPADQEKEVKRMLAAGEISLQGLISPSEAAFGAGRLVDSLRKQPGWSDYRRALDTMPSPAFRGSQEAVDAINRARYGVGQTDLPTEIKALVDYLKQAEIRRQEQDKTALAVLRELRDKKILLEVVGGPK